MSPAQSRVSAWQIGLLVFVLSLCLTPFDLPALLVPRMGARSAWWGMLPALFVGLWGIAVAVALSRRSTGRSLDRTVLAAMGPVAGYSYLVALTALFVFSVPGCLLVFGPAAHDDLLPRVPIAFVAVMVACVGVYAARSGPETIGRCAEALAPFLVVGLAGIYAPMVGLHLSFARVLPVHPPTWSQWISPQVAGATGTIRGFLPLLVLGPAIAGQVPALRFGLASTLAWLLIVLSLIMPVVIFNGPLVREFNFPFLAAEATIGWHWLPLRSLVDLTLLIWCAVTFLVFSTYLWMAGWLLRQLIPALPRRGPVEVLGVGAAVVASVPFSAATFHAMFIAWNVGVILLGVVVPTGLLLLAGRSVPAPVPSGGADT